MLAPEPDDRGDDQSGTELLGFVSRVRVGLARIRRWNHQNRWVGLAVAGPLFLLALLWSIHAAGLRPAAIEPRFFLANVLILTPLTLLLNAFGLSVSAWSLGARVPMRTATQAFATGIVADMLPVPGSLTAHMGALYLAGIPSRSVALLMAGRFVLLFGLAATVAAALSAAAAESAAVIAWLGGGLALLGALLLWACCGIRGAAAVAGHRVASFLALTLRLWVAFAALGVAVPLADVPVVATGGILGSAGFLAPGGLGIGEALGALAAPLVDADPAAAFAALALNRLLMFAICGAIVLLAVNRREVERP